jgi:hypothetical protein
MRIDEKIDKHLGVGKYSGVNVGVNVVLRIQTSPFDDDDTEDAGFAEAEDLAILFCKQIKKIRMKQVEVKIAEPSGNSDAIFSKNFKKKFLGV